MATREVKSFASLMALYGAKPEEFGWEFEMSSLEKHICYLCSYKLNHVTPSQVSEELYYITSAALEEECADMSIYNNYRGQLDAAIQATYYCLLESKFIPKL
jgi:hypothetical protein